MYDKASICLLQVRFVGDPERRIKEDYLRILRYFRFYGRISTDEHQHEQETLDIVKDLASGLKQVAVERIWVEVGKILVGNLAPHLVRLMYKLGVAENIGKSYCLSNLKTMCPYMYGKKIRPLIFDLKRLRSCTCFL